MKIQVASDLHLELLRVHSELLVSPAPEAEVLVLAGDISSGTAAIELFASWPVPVLYVAGNHEFYRQNWEGLRRDLRAAAKGTNVHFLDNTATAIGGVRFLGATLWTDFLFGTSSSWNQSAAMEYVTDGLNDYHLIDSDSDRLQAQQTLDDHMRSRRWLARQLTRAFNGPTVVVTHHGCHPLSIHPRFAGDRLNAGFVSDLTPLLQHADLWVHGHVHDCVDYQVGRCRVVGNPAGYARNRGGIRHAGRATWPAMIYELENPKFDAEKIVSVGADVPKEKT